MHLRTLVLLALVFAAFAGEAPEAAKPAKDVTPEPIADFLWKGIHWLAEAQHEGGGWGAGSHAKQQIRDPSKVQTDPATTSFAALALIRAGHTPTGGKYKKTVLKATEYVVRAIEKSPDEGPRITDLKGTQPQAKLGQLVDTSLAVQLLSRVVPLLPRDHALHERADEALSKALGKLQKSQGKDGSWNARGGWAAVLQSSVSSNALELADVAGKPVSKDALERARAYQKGNLDRETGRAAVGASAGVELYAWAGAGRAAAGEARAAEEIVNGAKEAKKVPADAPVSEKTLRDAGVEAPKAARLAVAYEAARAQEKRLDDAGLLKGFGNNGGEEFLSYKMTSEALVIRGGEPWEKWNAKMHKLLKKVQRKDGSWTGHHCITSPVFCTAAVVATLTADRDVEVLRKIAAKDAKDATAAEDAKAAK